MQELKKYHEQEYFNQELEISFAQCDHLGRLKMNEILVILTEIAGEDYELRGMGRDKLIKSGFVFIISRFAIHFNREIKYPEILTARTWELGARGVQFYRNFEILDTNQNVVANAVSTWPMINPENHRIMRPNNYPFNDLRYPGTREFTNCLPLDRIDVTNGKLLGERIIKYTDLDGNGHTNNSRYGAIALDFLPSQYHQKVITDFHINFVSETRLDEVLEIYGYGDEHCYVLKGTRDQQDCFECKFIFA